MAKFSREEFERIQKKPQAALPKTDLSGKVVCVVGANTGLGFEAAKHFASMNPAKLIVTARDAMKGEATVKRLVADTNFERVELGVVDLSSFDSVRTFADKLSAENDRLDLLIENAGILSTEKKYTSAGWESMLQVNNLSPELLAILLLPKMIETATKFSTVPRLVVTSSSTHLHADVPKEALAAPKILEKLNDNDFCTTEIMHKRYFLSKFFNIFFVRGLSERLPRNVLAAAADPGLCHTELARNTPLTEAQQKVKSTFAFTAEEGSRHVVYPAVAALDGDQLRGAYFSCSEITEVSDVALGEEGKKIQDRLWDETVEILGGVDPRVKEIVGRYLS